MNGEKIEQQLHQWKFLQKKKKNYTKVVIKGGTP